MYRTGDRCRYRADGTIEYFGRIDNQVKLRGFRIELGEIESLLAQHPAVQHAVVAVREDSPGDKRLVGYLVCEPGQQVSAAEARDYLRQSLPDYMVPSVLVPLEALPLTPNGKVDRKALPKVDASDTAHAVVAPRTALEEKLLAMWKKVLRNPGMGVTDNFFDLGGHSLMAAQLISEMEKALGRKIPLAALFRGATVERMARLLQDGTESSADPIVMKLQTGRTVPFFAVVAPGMDAIGYAALAQAMGANQSFYKLQSHRAIKPDAPISLDEMREIAADYIQAMRTVQPKGPYYLGGMCAGTHIGEQMILQLEAEGEKIALFAIFDTWVRQNSHVRWKWRIFYYRQRLRGMLRLSLREQMKMVRKALTKKLHRVATLSPKVETSWSKLYWPGKDFQTPHFQAPVALFKRPKQPFYYVKDESMGWAERSQQDVQIYEIDFPHRMLREPYVRELAKYLVQCLSHDDSSAAGTLKVAQEVTTPSKPPVVNVEV
jgi:thioesterase domain-containing protein/acyl carrier protein